MGREISCFLLRRNSQKVLFTATAQTELTQTNLEQVKITKEPIGPIDTESPSKSRENGFE